MKGEMNMTPEEFKIAAQKIYDSCRGNAGEDEHYAMDELMAHCLGSLGYGEGVEILFSMNSIGYS